MNVFDTLFPKRTRAPKNRLRDRLSDRRNRLSGLGLPEQFERRELFAISAVVPNTPASFFIDTTRGLNCEYAAFSIQNDSVATGGDVWVKAANFSSPNPSDLKLGLAEDGVYRLDPLGANQSGMAYFYFTASGTSNAPQKFDIQVYDVDPASPGASPKLTLPWQFTDVQDTNQAYVGKINTVDITPQNPSVGDAMYMTVTGELGNNLNRVLFAPATKSNWLPDVYELRGTDITISGQPANTPPNRLYVDSFPTPALNQQPYTIKYTFVIAGPSTTSTQTSPTAYSQQGSQPWKEPAPPATPLPFIPELKYKLTLTKGDGITEYTPGGATTYTITLTNTGNVDVNNVSIQDAFPQQLAAGTYWTVTYANASSGTVGGLPNGGTYPGPISGTVNLGKLTGTVTILIFAQIRPDATGDMTNTVYAQAPNDTQLSASDTNSCRPVADLSIAKTGPATYVPGQPISYSFVVTNNGPSFVTGAAVTDLFSASGFLSNVTWNVTYSTGGSGLPQSGNGDIVGKLINLPVSGTATFTITADVTSTATGDLKNTASVYSATDPTPGNNSSTVTSTCAPSTDLSIAKTGPATYVPGQPISYSFVVTNNGPSFVTGAAVTDLFSASGFLSNVTWNVTYSTGGSGLPQSGNGDIVGKLINLPVSGTATFTITADVTSTATGDLKNTASVYSATDPTPGNNSSTVTSTCAPSTDLSIAKTGPATYVPGQPISYSFVVTNNGPSFVTGAAVTDLFSASGFLSNVTWNVTYSTGGSGLPQSGNGDIVGKLINLPVSGTATFTITADVTSTATGDLKNTASVYSATDPTPGNNSSTVTSTCAPSTDLSIAKTGPATYVPGQPISYSFVVTNNGPSFVTGAAVTDLFSASGFLSNVTWNVTYSTGGSGLPQSGNGDIVGKLINLPVSGTATFTITADVTSTATGDLKNTASVYSATDPTPGNNSSTVTSTCAPSTDLSIAKTGPATYVPGQPISYSFVVTNNGPSFVTGAAVTDLFSASGFLSNVTWNVTYSTGGSGLPQSGNGDIVGKLINLPVSGTATFTITADVTSTATGDLKNTASVYSATDPTPGNNSSTVTSTCAPSTDLSIAKTGPATYVPGQPISYSFVVTNNGPSFVTGAAVTDLFSASGFLSNVTWNVTYSTGGSGLPQSGNGDIVGKLINLPVSGTATFTITADVTSTATGDLKNTASVYSATDPTPGNNSSTVTSTCAPSTDLSIAKTGPATYVPGQPISYSFVVTNNGPSFVTGAAVTDLFSASGFLSNVTWNVTYSTGGSGLPQSGNGDIVGKLINLPVSGTATFTITADVTSTATGDLKNTASVYSATDPTPGNNSSTVTSTCAPSTDLSIAKTGPATYVPGQPISYSFVVTNNGPSFVTGAAVTDLFSASGFLSNVTWNVTYSTGGSGLPQSGNGDIVGKLINLPVSGTATFTITADVTSTATGDLKNTASVYSATDPTPGNNSSTVTSTCAPSTDLSIAKTGPATYVPGQPISYSFVVTNNGPSFVTGAAVTDLFSASGFLSNVTWNVTYSTGGSGLPQSGNGDIVGKLINLPVSGTATFTITADVTSTATGDLKNTASVYSATDPTPGNNSSTVTSTCAPSTDLSIAKTGPATYVPGQPISYSFVVTNNGPSFVTGAAVTDLFSASGFLSNVTWNVTYSTGGSGLPQSGNGDIVGKLINLPVSGTATFTITADVTSTATGDLKNTASVYSATDPTPGNNSSTVTSTCAPSTDLSIAKTGPATYVPGQPISYSFVVTNNGPSFVTGAAVTDLFSASGFLSNVTWNVTYSTGGSGLPQSGNGDIVGKLINLPVSGTATFTITADVSSTATGDLKNTASVYSATDPTPGNNSSTVTSTCAPSTDLSIAKTGPATYVPGQPISYSFVVTNNGPSFVTGAAVTDLFSASGFLSNVTWNVTYSTGGSGLPQSGNGDIVGKLINLPVSGTATFTITADVSSTATGDLKNTASVYSATDPTPGNNSSTVTSTCAPSTDLSIAKTGPATYVPGQPISYSFVVTNNGPSFVTGAAVTDLFSASGFLSNVTWNVTYSTGGSGLPQSGNGDIVGKLINLPVSGTATFTITADVTSTATGDLKNTASVYSATDPTPGNNSSTVTSTCAPSTDLSIAKTGPATYVPGQPISYSFVVTNNGPSFVTGAAVTDLFSASGFLSNVTWNVTYSTGGSGLPQSGNGDIVGKLINLPVSGTATFTITADVSSTATGDLKNTASVYSATDPTPGNNSSTVTSTCAPSTDLSIAKTGPATYVPGQPISYSFVVTNNGPSFVTGAAVTDLFSASGFLSNVTWNVTYSTGGSGLPQSGNGDIVGKLINLPVSGTATFTITADVSSTATGDLKNTASVYSATDPTPGNNSSTVTSTCAPSTDLSIAKTGPATYVPGQPISYSFVVTNNGPSFVTGAAVTDLFSASGFLSNVTWNVTYSTGGSGLPQSGNGDIVGKLINLPVSGTATFTITADVTSTATGDLKNTASVYSATDPTPGNNSSTVTSTCTPVADLSIVKTADVNPALPGSSITYTLLVSNVGPSDVVEATVSDTFPASITTVSWSTSVTGGAVVTPVGGSGSPLSATVSIPRGDTVTFTVVCGIDPLATGTLTNTATVTPPEGTTDPNPDNNTSTVTVRLQPTADLSVVKIRTGDSPVVAGSPVTYSIVVTNGGPSSITSFTLTDVSNPSLLLPGYSVNTGNYDPGTGIWTAAAGTSFDSGESVTFTLTGTVPAAATGNQVNTATVLPPDGVTDPDLDNNTSTVTDPISLVADLSIVKTADVNPAIPGQSITYTLLVTNGGPSDVVGATVNDTFPGSITTVSWTTSVTGGAVVTPVGGSGSPLTATVSIPRGDTVTFTVVCGIDPLATGTLTNTATVTLPEGTTDPTPDDNTSTVTVELQPTADLSVVKTRTGDAPVAGSPVTYSIVVSNAGPSSVTSFTLTDVSNPGLLLPGYSVTTGIYNPGTGIWTADLGDSFDSGESVTFTLTGTVPAAATGNQVNTATVLPPDGVTDPDLNNNTSTVTDPLSLVADLAVTKAFTGGTYAPNGTIVYTIVVTNNGPSFVTGGIVNDPLPVQIASATWTVAYVGIGSTGPADGTGDIVNQLVNLSVGGTATFTVTCKIVPAPQGDPSNTVTIDPPADTFDPNLANNTATETIIVPFADIRALVVGSDDGCNGPPLVHVLDPNGGFQLFQFLAYEKTFRGSVRVATGDVTGDGIPEIVVGPGRSRVGQIRVFTPNPIGSTNYTELVGYRTLPFGAAYRGGVEVAVGDINGDNVGDIIAGQSSGAGLVRAFLCSPNNPVNLNFDGVANNPALSFRPFPGPYVGGVMVAAGDFGRYANGVKIGDGPDGKAEIVVGSNAGIRATVKVYDVSGVPTVVRTILPFGPKFKGGVTLSVAKYNSDTIDDLIVGAGVGGNSAVEIYDGATGGSLAKLSAFASFAKPNARVFTAGLDTVQNPGTVQNIYGVKGLTGGGGAKGVRAYNKITTQSSTLPLSTFLAPPLRIAPIIVRVTG